MQLLHNPLSTMTSPVWIPVDRPAHDMDEVMKHKRGQWHCKYHQHCRNTCPPSPVHTGVSGQTGKHAEGWNPSQTKCEGLSNLPLVMGNHISKTLAHPALRCEYLNTFQSYSCNLVYLQKNQICMQIATHLPCTQIASTIGTVGTCHLCQVDWESSTELWMQMHQLTKCLQWLKTMIHLLLVQLQSHPQWQLSYSLWHEYDSHIHYTQHLNHVISTMGTWGGASGPGVTTSQVVAYRL
jgi:hypothetical protein